MNIEKIVEIASDDIFEDLLNQMFNVLGKEKCMSVMKNLKSINHNIFLRFFRRFYLNNVTLMYGVNSQCTEIYVIDFIIDDDLHGSLLDAESAYTIPIKKIFGEDGIDFLKNVSIDQNTHEINNTKFQLISMKELKNTFNINKVDLRLMLKLMFKDNI
jgi:hypothetical protein